MNHWSKFPGRCRAVPCWDVCGWRGTWMRQEPLWWAQWSPQLPALWGLLQPKVSALGLPTAKFCSPGGFSSPPPAPHSQMLLQASGWKRFGVACDVVFRTLKCLRSLKVQFSKNRHPQASAWGAGDRNSVSKLLQMLDVVSENAPAYAGLVPAVDSSLKPLCLLDLEHYKFYFGVLMYKSAVSGNSRIGIIKDISLPLLLVGI